MWRRITPVAHKAHTRHSFEARYVRLYATPGFIGEAGVRLCATPGLIGEAGVRLYAMSFMSKKIILSLCLLFSVLYPATAQDEGYLTGLVGAVQSAYEVSAKSTVVGIANACEMFMAENGSYPLALSVLTRPEAAYLTDKPYSEGFTGYRYSFKGTPAGYIITAMPLECGKTGTKIFIKESSKDIIGKDCRT
ncbi:MAG: hypothetical protein KKF80_04145 [Candidatus Omnitrophica bacterium]|nr:hypothetical protein [Candidatus Omnitrophota bacterium]